MTDKLPPDGLRESGSAGGGVARRRRPKDRMAKGGVRDPALRTGLPRLWAQLTSWLLAYLPGRHRPRLPRVHIHTAPAIPSVVLRAIVALIGFGCGLMVVPGPPGWTIVIGLLVALFWVPGSLVGGALVIVLGLLLAFDVEPGAPWRTPLLVAALPLMLQLAAIAGQTSITARIELRALALPLRRYLAIQVFAQLLALTGAMVAGLGWVLPQLMALAAVALLSIVIFWIPSLGPARSRDY